MPPPAKLVTAIVGARDRTADKGLLGLTVMCVEGSVHSFSVTLVDGLIGTYVLNLFRFLQILSPFSSA